MVYIFYYILLNYIVKKLHNAYNILHSYYIVSMQIFAKWLLVKCLSLVHLNLLLAKLQKICNVIYQLF